MSSKIMKDFNEYKLNKEFEENGLVKINNVFSDNEIIELSSSIIDHVASLVHKDYELFEQSGPNSELGRFQVGSIVDFFSRDFELRFRTKMENKVYKITKSKMNMGSVIYVEYSKKYGEPNLPPHFDGDSSDLIINYQLDSNISWSLGLNKSLYSLENNSALVFNPNTNIHWRPIIDFNKGDYVKMIFFRFKNSEIDNDYSHLSKLMQNDPMFVEVDMYRRKLAKK